MKDPTPHSLGSCKTSGKLTGSCYHSAIQGPPVVDGVLPHRIHDLVSYRSPKLLGLAGQNG